MLKKIIQRNNRKGKRKSRFPFSCKTFWISFQILLISVCYYEEELEETLKRCFQKDRKKYIKKMIEKKKPELLVEQFMEGEMFSIDGYITSKRKSLFLSAS